MAMAFHPLAASRVRIGPLLPAAAAPSSSLSSSVAAHHRRRFSAIVATAAASATATTEFDFKAYMGERAAVVNRALDAAIPAGEPPAALHEAMRYALLAGGKRVRPALCLAACGVAGGREAWALAPAAAVEQNYPPVAGTILHQLLNFSRLMEYHTELSRRHRTFRMLTPTCNYVYTVEPANVEYILKTNFANYVKGAMMHDTLEDLLGDGIFNVDGAMWRHQRKVASHEFSTRVLYSSAVFRDTAVELAAVVVAAGAGAGRDDERAVDMQDLLMRSTLDSIFKVGFGVSLGALSGSCAEGAAFDDASEQALYRFLCQQINLCLVSFTAFFV